ncbi:hypothetical protein PIB30_014195 [Stylosanthes scabra]|uniref:Uncharacterized protein n=1 Tax=Stylosanthes scabra TaxID=79078 RepID=A0ABU6V701_9FABA|nr:hypothetical protein [Stylosanthes scabra]
MSSESEDSIERPNGPKQKSLDSRCSPSFINDIFVALEKKNIKLDEIDTMGFGGLKHIPKWSVDQESYFYLAKNFNLTSNYIRIDVDDIVVNVALIGCALDLPSYGLEFPTLDRKIHAICSRWSGSTNLKLKKFIETCPMETHVQKMEFKQAFILFVVKSFHILDWVKDDIADFQHSGVKHISGCIDDMEEGGDDPLGKKRETTKKESHKKKRKEGEDDVTFDKTEEIQMENHNAVKERWKEIEKIIDNDLNCNSYEEFNSSESQGRPSFSLRFSQDSKSPTPSTRPTEKILNIPPVSHVLPIDNHVAMMLSKGLSEVEIKKIYSWVMKSSKQESVMNETIASFKGKFEFSLSRDDMMCLKPREWISNNVRL